VRGAARAALLTAAAALLAAPGRSADCPAVDPPPRICPAIDPVTPVRRAGLRIFLDRRTGRVRPPTPEEARALFETGGRSVEYLEPLEVVVSPDGMRSIDLKGAFESRLEVRRRPDGSLDVQCRTGGPEEPRR
jgi:hypothetical protein